MSGVLGETTGVAKSCIVVSGMTVRFGEGFGTTEHCAVELKE